MLGLVDVEPLGQVHQRPLDQFFLWIRAERGVVARAVDDLRRQNPPDEPVAAEKEQSAVLGLQDDAAVNILLIPTVAERDVVHAVSGRGKKAEYDQNEQQRTEISLKKGHALFLMVPL